MDDAHSHVHVLDGVHDVDPQHEVGDQPKEDEHCHMDSSQTSPMGSFPENCLPANVYLNFLFLCELLTLRLTFWEDLHQAHRHIWLVGLMGKAAWCAPPPPSIPCLPSPGTPWWFTWRSPWQFASPKESLDPADSRKIMIDNRESSNFNMLLWFVNLQSIKKLLMLSRVMARGCGEEQGPILSKEILL